MHVDHDVYEANHQKEQRAQGKRVLSSVTATITPTAANILFVVSRSFLYRLGRFHYHIANLIQFRALTVAASMAIASVFAAPAALVLVLLNGEANTMGFDY